MKVDGVFAVHHVGDSIIILPTVPLPADISIHQVKRVVAGVVGTAPRVLCGLEQLTAQLFQLTGLYIGKPVGGLLGLVDIPHHINLGGHVVQHQRQTGTLGTDIDGAIVPAVYYVIIRGRIDMLDGITISLLHSSIVRRRHDIEGHRLHIDLCACSSCDGGRQIVQCLFRHGDIEAGRRSSIGNVEIQLVEINIDIVSKSLRHILCMSGLAPVVRIKTERQWQRII